MTTIAERALDPSSKKAIAAIQGILRSSLPSGTFQQRETLALAVSNEAVREFLREELQEMADGLGENVLVEGVLYGEHEPGSDTYYSLCGPLDVNRPSYRKVGERNGPTVIALDLLAGLVRGATPALAYSAIHGYAQHDMRAHLETLRAAHRVPPSRTTLENICKAVAGEAAAQTASIEKLVRQREKVPLDAVAISIGLDRTSVAMVEDRPQDAPPKPEPKRRKPLQRCAPEPYDVNWRMAYVGTLSFVDENAEVLLTRRYAAAACDDPRDLVERMTADVSAALRRRPLLQVGIVQDGAPEMWNRTCEGLQVLRDKGQLQDWHEAVDRFHLMEHLAKALKLVEPSASDEQRKAQLKSWSELFDTTDTAIDVVEACLIKGYDNCSDQSSLWEELRYIRNHKHRMRYVTLRQAGLPVGSGITESSAKSVIGQRAKRSGQRWREHGLRGVLTLRALLHSDRLHAFWSHLAKHYTAEVLVA